MEDSKQPKDSLLPRCCSNTIGIQKLKLESNDGLFPSNQPSSNNPVARKGPRGGVTHPFPSKLFELLESHEFDEIISWQPDGRSFILHDALGFVDLVMPLYFKQTKFRSFQRQLNLYDFKRIESGYQMGGYYHPMFLRDQPEICRTMTRHAVKSRIRGPLRNVKRSIPREVQQRRPRYDETSVPENSYKHLALGDYYQKQSSPITETSHALNDGGQIMRPCFTMIDEHFSQHQNQHQDSFPNPLHQSRVAFPSYTQFALSSEPIHHSTIENSVPQLQFRCRIISESSLFETPDNSEDNHDVFDDLLSDNMSFSLESSELDLSDIFDADDYF